MSPAKLAVLGALMKNAEVRAFAGNIGRTTLYDWVRKGLFPAPRRLPSGARRWVRSEVEAWAASLPKTGEP